MSGAPKLVPSTAQIVDLNAGPVPAENSQNIGVGNNLSPQDLLRFATDHGFHHLCQRDGFKFDNEIRVSQNLIANPESFFLHPIANILSPDLVDPNSEASLIKINSTFDSSSQKRTLLESIQTYMANHKLSQTLTDDVSAVADEFITNAVFNAPFVDMRTNANPGLSRLSGDVTLTAGKAGRLLVAHDDTSIVIGCEDPFGSLNLNHYLNKIRTTYLRGPAATMNFGSGGAGLGSYIIFNAGSSLYFGVKKSRVTLLCCAIPLKMSFKKRVQLPKHLHVIQL